MTSDLFDVFDDAETPSEVLGYLAGAASVCWSDPGGAGVFDNQRASALVDAALQRLIVLGFVTWNDTP